MGKTPSCPGSRWPSEPPGLHSRWGAPAPQPAWGEGLHGASLQSKRELQQLLMGNKTGKFRADFHFKHSKCITPITLSHSHGAHHRQPWPRPGQALSSVPDTWLFPWPCPQKVLVASPQQSRQPLARPIPSPLTAAKANSRASVSVCPGLRSLLAFGPP